ncbi:MAG: hypothetical protein LBL96_00160 [Clostridiales bacterium]|jgi:hypothetical protein|nr:hypothetical protein [Clostridiales bacterium]
MLINSISHIFLLINIPATIFKINRLILTYGANLKIAVVRWDFHKYNQTNSPVFMENCHNLADSKLKISTMGEASTLGGLSRSLKICVKITNRDIGADWHIVARTQILLICTKKIYDLENHFQIFIKYMFNK